MAKKTTEGAEFKYLERNKFRDIPEIDHRTLNTLIGQTYQMEPLPDEILDEYWRWKELADRGNVAFSAETLVSIIRLSGVETAPPPKATLIELNKAGKLKFGTEVEALWHDTEWKKATFVDKNVRENTVRLVFADDVVPRWWPVQKCRLIAPAEVKPDGAVNA